MYIWTLSVHSATATVTVTASLIDFHAGQKLFPLKISRRAVRRKVNLEVTGEEKPKTCLRRRKANKRLCREKKPVCALPDEEKTVSLVSDEKKPVCAVLGWKITTNNISREKKNRNLLAKILLILLISRTRNLESIYWKFPVHHRLWTSV